ncbi:MAG: filamentous hemagglutinin N-terminal domain-containing protein [Nitrospira sp.]|nr:filamentous hemagglutinin N-terminal domain-containing protein [Nitrospira sp.]
MKRIGLKDGSRHLHMHDVAPFLASLVIFPFYFLTLGHAQISPPITSSGLNTVVTTNGNVHSITGGTRPGNGTNLFHSFGEFGVPTNSIASFLNETALPTNNILGRVTGGNPSNIFGTVQTTGFDNANLFLMNPAGIIFGPNATLNIGGSVTFTTTTADYIRLATDNVRFNAIPNAAADALLNTAPVAAFGFLGSNPGTITVQGSQLSVSEGQGISLVGGNITVQAGTLDDGTVQPTRLSAPGGQINLASVASPGEIAADSFLPSPGTTMGHINLSQGSLLDVSADAAGAVRIRGGQFVMDQATISTDTANVNGTPVAIDINVTGDMSISNDGAPALTAKSSGSGDAGEIRIVSANLTVTSTALDSTLALIDTHTSGMGRAGKVSITTGNLEAGSGVWFIDSGTSAAGHGNDVIIDATSAHFNDVNISTGDFRAHNQDIFDATGFAGNIRLTADSLNLVTTVLSTDSFLGRGGESTLTARTIEMTNGLIGSLSLGGSGAVTIAADSIRMTRAQIETETAFEPGRAITLTGKVIELRDGTSIRNQTSGNADAGNILVAATDRLTLSDQPTTSRPTGLYTNSLGVEGEPLDTLGGKSGSITITTPLLEMSGGARINTTTETSGRGGDVTIVATDLLSISGERRLPIAEDELSLGATNPGGIFTRTVGNQYCSGPCGNAGHISITTGSMNLNSGAAIDSGTSSTGQGGAIGINATNAITLSGTLADGTPGGIFSRAVGTSQDSGSGGNIALTAGQSVSISDGASVSASSTGPGNAGNIAINAGQQFEMRNSSVKTEAAQASGGNIDIQAIDRIRLVNSSISTSVLGGAGSGGNITIDPNVVILQNSQVIAQAFQGSGGNISITTPLFLADASSLVDASSQFGLNGTVNIQSPTSNLAGTVSSLPSSLRQVQSLQTGRCAALADSRSSSLIVAGRDNLPAEPGGWSPSPFALMGEETDSLAIASPPVATMTASADAPVSLRRLTPAGFLTQRFAENGLTGCRA